MGGWVGGAGGQIRNRHVMILRKNMTDRLTFNVATGSCDSVAAARYHNTLTGLRPEREHELCCHPKHSVGTTV